MKNNVFYIGLNFSKDDQVFHFITMNKKEFYQHAETSLRVSEIVPLNDEQLIELQIVTLKTAIADSEKGLISRETLHQVTGAVLTAILVLTDNFEHALKHYKKYAICLSLDMNLSHDDEEGKVRADTQVGYFLQPKKFLKRKPSNNNRSGTKKARTSTR